MAKRASGRRKVSSDRLKKIKAKMAQAHIGGENQFWKPDQGDNIIRILPGVDDMDEVFFVEIGTHFFEHAPKQFKAWICPQVVFDEPCPICEHVAALYATGDEDDKALADKLSVQNSWPMNIIVRGESNEAKGPQIYQGKVTVMRQIFALIQDPEYGDEILDIDNGLDLKLTRTGQQRQTSYNISPRRRNSPLSKDENIINKWIDSMVDLTPVRLTEDPEDDSRIYNDETGRQVAVFGVAPYDRILAEFEDVSPDALADDEDEEYEEWDEDEEEDEWDEDEEEDEEDWEEEDEEEDDDDEEDEDDGVAKAREAIQRRRGRANTKSSAPAKSRTPRRRSRR